MKFCFSSAYNGRGESVVIEMVNNALSVDYVKKRGVDTILLGATEKDAFIFLESV